MWHKEIDRVRDNQDYFEECMKFMGEQECISAVHNFASMAHSWINEKFGDWLKVHSVSLSNDD